MSGVDPTVFRRFYREETDEQEEEIQVFDDRRHEVKDYKMPRRKTTRRRRRGDAERYVAVCVTNPDVPETSAAPLISGAGDDTTNAEDQGDDTQRQQKTTEAGPGSGATSGHLSLPPLPPAPPPPESMPHAGRIEFSPEKAGQDITPLNLEFESSSRGFTSISSEFLSRG